MLLFTVNAPLAVAKNSKVPADALSRTDTDMREETLVPVLASAVVSKMDTKRGTLWGWIVR